MLPQFLLYLFRWQLSTPILAPIVAYFKHSTALFGTREDWIAATIANLVGGCIFFWVDRYIFTGKGLELWQISEGACASCGSKDTLYRLVQAKNYDRTTATPIFLCEPCSKVKLELLRTKGVKASAAYVKLQKN